MEQDCEQSDDALGKSIYLKQVFPAWRIVAAEAGSDCHSGHEDCKHQGLGIGGMPQKQFHIVGPDGFVNKGGKPRQCEKGIKETAESYRHFVALSDLANDCKFPVRAVLQDNRQSADEGCHTWQYSLKMKWILRRQTEI